MTGNDMTDRISNTSDVNPTVSVIMNCLNGAKYLREAIDSVYTQTLKDWEIIFWDNASMDNSAEIAKSYDWRLRYFRGDKTVPLYAARNLALKKANGRYIAILDCDDIWLPAKLEEQVPLFERDAAIGLVFSDSISFNEKGMEKKFFHVVKPSRGYVFQKLLVCNFIHLPTVMIRKESFCDLSMQFDDRFNMMGDYDAWLRMSYKWKLDYVNKTLARYRVHSRNLTNKYGLELSAYEYDLMRENLKKTIDEFENIYSKENKLMVRKRDVLLALLEWRDCNNKKARKWVKKYILDSVVYFAFYVLLFFPYKYVFNPLYKMYNKNITPTG
jgi:glycosyltransferase involved in cell wall biosynthesis